MLEQLGRYFPTTVFVFEDLNGFIVRHIHGTQGIDTQIINSINIVQAIPILREKYTNDPEILDFYNGFQPQHHNMGQQIETGILNVGSIVNTELRWQALRGWSLIGLPVVVG